jgi:hypothetical protein
MRYSYYDGASWHHETLARGEWPKHMSLQMDHADLPHIAYYRNVEPLDGVRYMFHDGNQWHVQTVDSGYEIAQSVSLELDRSEHPQISYYDVPNELLKYARYDGADWHIEVVDSGLGRYGPCSLERSCQLPPYQLL